MSSQVPTLEGGMRPVYIEEMFLYSFLYAGGCAFCQAFFTATVAYCTARYKGKVASFIHSIVIVTLILPVVGSLASTLQMAYELNLVNNMFGMYVLKVSFNNMYYLILTVFSAAGVRRVPRHRERSPSSADCKAICLAPSAPQKKEMSR